MSLPSACLTIIWVDRTDCEAHVIEVNFSVTGGVYIARLCKYLRWAKSPKFPNKYLQQSHTKGHHKLISEAKHDFIYREFDLQNIR
jgi:hypothetical protein